MAQRLLTTDELLPAFKEKAVFDQGMWDSEPVPLPLE